MFEVQSLASERSSAVYGFGLDPAGQYFVSSLLGRHASAQAPQVSVYRPIPPSPASMPHGVFEALDSLALEVAEAASERLITQLQELQARLAATPNLDERQLVHLIGRARVALRAQSLTDSFAQLDDPRVREFLLEHPFLLDALQLARKHIYKLLAPKRRPTTRLIVHSVEHDERELLVEIPTSLSVDEAMAAMDSFDEGWWLDQPNEVRSLLCFDLRFK